MSDDAEVAALRRRLVAHKWFYALFLGAVVSFVVLLLAGLSRAAYGVSGGLFVLAGLHALRYRNDIRVDVDLESGRIMLLPSLEARPARESAWQAVLAGLLLLSWGAVWLCIAGGLLP